MHLFRIVILSAVTFLAGCASSTKRADAAGELVPGDPSAPSQVTPSEAMAIAEKFSKHAWRPYAKNILHGKDNRGVLVNTPDASFKQHPERPGWWVPGEVNRGIPYKWGGFDSAESFETGVGRGLAAGDVSTSEKRRLDQAAVSAEAAGVDCSGFVSRCLKLPSVHDTTQLPSICTVLPSAAELRPGDLLNISRRHVLLCAGWVDADRKWIYFYETGGAPDYWKPGLKQAPIDGLLALGYQPLRYRGMAREARTDGKQVLTRAARETVDVVPNPTIGEP